MKHQNIWNRLLSSLTVLALLLSGVSAWGQKAGAEPVSAAAFTDVAQSHWASKHIAKLALQGIVKGYNGQFKPNDNVTQQEAVVMAIRFIGKESEVREDEAIVFASGFEVGGYFKPYISLAFKLGLMDQKEEFTAAQADPKAAWGSRKASREWVTKLIVKAIGEKDTAEQLAGTASAFKDADKMGSGYAGYINAAVSLELIKGITADKFDPKGSITRASIATIFSRAENKFPVQYEGQINGIATAISESAISLYDENGDKTYKLNSATQIYRYDSEKRSSLDKLTAQTDFLVIADGSGNALYIEQLKDEQHVEKITGTVDRVLPSTSVIWVWVNDEPVAVGYDGSVVVKNGTGEVIKVTDLAEDSKVVISRDTYRAKPLAVSIEVESAPVNKSGEGVVKEITRNPASVTVFYPSTEKTETFDISSDVDVIWQGTLLTDGLSSVNVGDTIKFEVKNSLVIKITVQSTASLTVNGTFVSANEASSTIQYMKGDKLEAKFVADNFEVIIEGMNGATLGDLEEKDEIQLTLNSQNKVTSVKVLDRKVAVLNGVQILSYNKELKALTVVDSGTKKLASVFLTSSTKITMNGNAIPLSAAESMFSEGRKVSIGYASDNAVFVEFIYKYTGEVLSLNTTTKQIKLALTNGSTITIGIQFNTVQLKGVSNATLSDVKVGDTVTGLLNSTQDAITALQVHKSVQYKIDTVTASSSQLKVVESGGGTATYNTASWKLYDADGKSIAFSKLQAGQVVNISFVGDIPDSLSVVNVSLGRVATVAADKIGVTGYDGTTFNFALQNTYTVVKDGITTHSASNLKAGDRVEVRKDADGNLLITVLSGVSKQFMQYDSVTRTLTVYKASLNDTNNTYKLTNKTVITQNDKKIDISALSNTNNLLLYFYQGELIEIVKVS